MIVDRKFGDFRKILALEFSLHILAPIIVMLGFLAGFSHISLVIYEYGLISPTLNDLPNIEKIMLLADSIVSLLLISGYLGAPIPGARLSFTFFNYMVILFRAQALIMVGRSLHRWQQVTAVRDALSEFDRNSKD